MDRQFYLPVLNELHVFSISFFFLLDLQSALFNYTNMTPLIVLLQKSVFQ